MKVKKWETVLKRIQKKHPYPKAIVGLDKARKGHINFSITKISKKGNPPIHIIHNTKKYSGFYDTQHGKWIFYDKEKDKRVKF